MSQKYYEIAFWMSGGGTLRVKASGKKQALQAADQYLHSADFDYDQSLGKVDVHVDTVERIFEPQQIPFKELLESFDGCPEDVEVDVDADQVLADRKSE